MNKEELTEKYFSNRLTEAEFLQLEKLLETDAVFREGFYSELELQQAISREKNRPLKERLQKLEKKPVKKNRWYLYAAAITIFLAIGFLFYEPQPNYEQLYATHFEAYPNVVGLTNRSDANGEIAAKKAFELYEAGNFREAAAEFKMVYKQNPQDYVHFYYGVSLMASDEVEQGIEVLEKHIWQETNNIFKPSMHWYVGLGYVKLKNIQNARFHLQKVAESENNLSNSAKEVLKKLN